MCGHPRSKLKRAAQRGRYDQATINAIVDEVWIAHVSFADASGQPFVIPMAYVREGGAIYLHGSIASRMLSRLGEGIDTCVCVTLIDGLLLARSHFHHSMNYCSVVAFGKAVPIIDPVAKDSVFVRFVDALIPGRAGESRVADRNEINATALLSVDIEEVSAKIRSGGLKDDPADRDLPLWCGVIPPKTCMGVPIPDDDVLPVRSLPDFVRRMLAAKVEASTPAG